MSSTQLKRCPEWLKCWTVQSACFLSFCLATCSSLLSLLLLSVTQAVYFAPFILFIFKVCLLILKRKKRRGWERERERSKHWLPPIHSLMGCRTCDLGMCPDWDLNPSFFGLWDKAPTNWATLARAVHPFQKALRGSRLCVRRMNLILRGYLRILRVYLQIIG